MAEVKHGHRRHPDYGGGASPTYTSWRCMIRRCYDPEHPSYPDYGGSGVQVCERWRKSFAAFLADMGERPSTGHTIGRIAPFADYGPGECEWQTRAQQNKGLRDTSGKLITVGEVTKTKSQWAADLGIKYHTLQKRLQRKWGNDAYTTPPGARRPSLNPLRYLVAEAS